MKRVYGSTLHQYRFSDGTLVTSYLPADELSRRMNRLDTLRVLTEQHEDPHSKSICRKALAAYNKLDNFTGIIRLTFAEKDWLGYMLESDMLDSEAKECIRFYCRIN